MIMCVIERVCSLWCECVLGEVYKGCGMCDIGGICESHRARAICEKHEIEIREFVFVIVPVALKT